MSALGSFGGIMTLLIMAITTFMTPLVGFKTNLALISALYTTKEKDLEEEEEGVEVLDQENTQTEEQPKFDSRVPFSYSLPLAILDYIRSTFFCCCCCFKCCNVSQKNLQF